MRRIASTNLRSERPYSPPAPFDSWIHGFSTRSVSPHKPISTANWNTTHSFVLSNPILSLLERCTSMSNLKQIQSQMTTTGLILDGLASSRLVAFCALFGAGDIAHCRKILKFVPNLKPFSWNVAIRRFSESEAPVEAFLLYREMLFHGGSRPDNYTYPLLFKACARSLLDCVGFQVLGHVFKMGFCSDVFVVNGMIHMLVSCGDIGEARRVFDESPVRDLVTWNSLINGYAHCGMAREALNLYGEMVEQGAMPDEVTMIGLVSSCAQLEDLSSGRNFHLFIQCNKVKLTIPLCNALMDMYVKCGNLEEAEVLFNNTGKKKTLVSWTTMLVGYAKFGLLDAARKLFDEMPEKDVIPWNAMIGAYAQAGEGKEALTLFSEMQAANVTPDEVTMVNCLSACSQLGALDFGVWIHRFIERKNLFLNVALGTALVDMYVKCANIEKALHIFHQMPAKNALTWTVMIGGLALHGNAHEAISYFSAMVETGLVPDEVTYLGLLSACCHGGLVNEGRAYFSEMNSKYKLIPKLKHYSCMVDLLGRAGLLDEAEALIRSMPIEPDAVVWGALFFACRMQGNVIMGEKAALKLLELDPRDSGIYVLLANMYGDADMWEKAKKIRYMMAQRGVEKTPGCSAIEVNGIINEFIVRDKSHPRSAEIYTCIEQLTKQMELIEILRSVQTVGWDSFLKWEL
ncbi:hypothetical protein V2J09_000983 [Rumex salicifolius]